MSKHAWLVCTAVLTSCGEPEGHLVSEPDAGPLPQQGPPLVGAPAS
jgi:hypothetical protein